MADGKIEIDLDLNDSGAQQKGKKAGDEIAKGVESGLKNVGKSADSAARDTEKALKSAANSAKSSFSDVGSAAKSGFSDVGDAAKTAANDASSAFESVPSDASGAFSDVSDQAKSGFDGISDAAQTAASDTSSAFDGVGVEIAADLDDVGDKADGVFGTNIPASTAIAGAAVGVLASQILEIGKNAVNTGMEFDQSMAQVAATMGVTVDEVQNLRDFAQQMGETTAFSASQSADALNYMALAGYDAETSMRVLPTVLNLAAAGNMDLAAASDMVTDAQSALGLSVEQAEVMVDQMAKTSSKTNTSVSQLGDAFLTVGGTAKNLKGGTAELAQMLGLLADNGVKGSEGGTALRNVILSLSAPTDKAATAIKSLGLEVFDAEGNMRSMPDIFNDMNAAMSKMTQQDRTEVLNNIFNKVDLKSVNALLGTSASRFDEVAGAIDNAQGAASQMAETQLDNLAGDVTLLESATEGFYIAVSDALTPALRGLTQFGTNSLMPFLTDGVKNFDKFAPAIMTMIAAIVLLGGKSLILRKLSTETSLLGKMVGVTGTQFTAMSTKAKMAAVATNTLRGAMNALKTAAPILAITALVEAGTLLYQAWQKDKEHTEKLTKATSGLESAATNAVSKINNEADSVERLGGAFERVDIDDFLEKHSQLADSINETNTEARTNEAMLSDYADTINRLAGETSLTEPQIAELKNAVSQVNEALGTSYTVSQDTGGAYQIMADGATVAKNTIIQLIEAQKAQVRAEADMENYRATYKQWQEDLQKTAEAKAKVEEASKRLAQAEQDANNATDPVARAKASADMATYGQALKDAQKDLEDIQNTTGATESTMNRLNERTNLNTMAMAENASAVIKSAAANQEFISGVQGAGVKLDDFVVALQDMGFTADQITNISQDDAMKLAQAWSSGSDDMKKAVEQSGTDIPNILESLGDQSYQAAESAGEQVNDGLADGMSNTAAISSGAKSAAAAAEDPIKAINLKPIGANATATFASGMGQNVGEVSRTSSQIGEAAVSDLDKSGEAESSGRNLVQGFINGMGSLLGGAINKAKELAQSAIDAIKKTGDEHSPWKTTYKSGVNAAKGLINGIKKEKKNAKKSGSALSQAIVDGANKRISNLKGINAVTVDYEVGFWTKIKAKTKKGSNAWYEASKKLIEAKKAQKEQIKKQDDAIISNATTWLQRYKLTHDVSLKYEMNYWNNKLTKVKKGSDAYYTALSKAKQAEDAYYSGIVSEASNYISRQRRLYTMSYQEEEDYWRNTLKQLKKGTKQYEEAYDNMLEAHKNAVEEIEQNNASLLDAEQDYVNKLRDIQKRLANDIQEAKDKYLEAVKERKNAILSDMNLFETYRKKVTISGAKLIENLQKQVAATEDYENGMKHLEERIGRGELYDEIAAMGMEGLRYVESLNDMTEEEIREFEQLYKKRNEIAQREATRDSQDQLNEMNDTINSLNKQAADEMNDASKELKGIASDLNTALSSTVAEMASNVKASADSITQSIEAAINSLNRLDNRVSTSSTSTSSYGLQPSQGTQIPIASVYNGRQIITDSNGAIQGISLLATDVYGATRQTEYSLMRGLEAANIAFKQNAAVGGVKVEQTNNFNVPIETPDDVSRAMRMQERYGLAGKYI